MSIVALKNKSYTLYGKSHSVGKDGFSLNGKIRPFTYNLGRSVTYTPFKGPFPKGHGQGSSCRVKEGNRGRTCGGTYPIQIIQSNTQEPQTEVKRSVMNTLGMIEDKYTGILHGQYPNTMVGPLPSTHAITYIEHLKNKSLVCENAYSTHTKYVDRPDNGSCVYAKDAKLFAHGYTNDYMIRYTRKCLETNVNTIQKNYLQCSGNSKVESLINKPV